MATDVSTFRARFPEFSDNTEYPDARIQLFLDDAQLEIGIEETRWGSKYDLAHAYLAAHLLVVGTQTEGGSTASNVGVISGKTAGGVSVTRSVSSKVRSDADEFYISTSYGQRFIIIRSSCFVGVLVANKTT